MPLYQSIKYFLTRAGLSLFILLVPGFFILYLVHEVALPQMQIDDSAIQWTLLLISLFFGFFGYGLIGDQRFQNAFHELKDAGPGDDPETTLPKFESLLEQTFSS
nr:hypothetical protein [Nitrospinaceae bacterium]NIR55183.1 hypothetical protein [Nitrospinaceae bacterium]NIS85607.1 hypothetical protein [Nitrospinaceae bacterium]NIT82453.1 hypothetical protein [Nitrospinaceae bacterium]NIU44666.1 hypothetical protein [Nitrospinaceae bacterium]